MNGPTDHFGCTLHLRWPFIRPPAIDDHQLGPKVVLSGALCFGAEIQVLVHALLAGFTRHHATFYWMLGIFIATGIVYVVLYRRSYRVVAVDEWRRRMRHEELELT